MSGGGIFFLLPRLTPRIFFLGYEFAGAGRDAWPSWPRLQKRSWVRLLAPDDAADVIQQCPSEEKEVFWICSITIRAPTCGAADLHETNRGNHESRFVRLRPM